MENFRTPITILPYNNKISYASKVFFIGSCFSENIYKKLKELRFNTQCNPYGVLFNPVSIKRALQEIIEKKQYTANDLMLHNELYHSMHHHGKFSTISQNETLSLINSNINESHAFLKQATHIFITLGTALVYKYKSEIVANCHKIPNKEFEKVLLNTKDVVANLKEIVSVIKSINASANVIFTVSPVRHLKDGMQENSLSKGILKAALAEIQVDYFPTYEIMMDDLRDYRFYEADMLHPNEVAINYIFEAFSTSYFNDETKQLMNRIQKYNMALNHRILHSETTASKKHQEFLEREGKEIEKMLSLY